MELIEKRLLINKNDRYINMLILSKDISKNYFFRSDDEGKEDEGNDKAKNFGLNINKE